MEKEGGTEKRNIPGTLLYLPEDAFVRGQLEAIGEKIGEKYRPTAPEAIPPREICRGLIIHELLTKGEANINVLESWGKIDATLLAEEFKYVEDLVERIEGLPRIP